MARVIVLGTLGELIKKICELELVNPAPVIGVQLTSYYKILESWPVLDKDRVERLCEMFKVQLTKHKDLEKQLGDNRIKGKLGSLEWLNSATATLRVFSEYLKSKHTLLELMAQLNSLGQHIGLPPVTIDLEEEDEQCIQSGGDGSGTHAI